MSKRKKSFLKILFTFHFSLLTFHFSFSQVSELNNYNIVWNEQSKNAFESMPCGGGSIGTNVWVENGELFLYLQQSGWFDENNTALKAGRIRIHLSPNPFEGKQFKQELILKDGYVHINGINKNLSADLNVWVEVLNPIVHIDIQSNQNIKATATYESWRYKDRILTGKENNTNSWKWAKHVKVIAPKDSIAFQNNQVVFFHRNTDSTVFDYTVQQQGLETVKSKLYNPLIHLTSGGIIYGNNMESSKVVDGKYIDTDFKGWQLKSRSSSKNHSIQICLNANQTTTTDEWLNETKQFIQNNSDKNIFTKTKQWWNEFWERSFIVSSSAKDSTVWKIGRNYQIFRYMLGCNAYGKYPTKFNGGLFTVDPVFTDTTIHATPDHRNWGGGTFTAQNQRLVYWPLLRSGDIDLMKTQLDYYNRILGNATLRTQQYWQHSGASFTEQMENFGLPNPAEYGYKRPDNFDKGVEYNAWLEYTWDTALEFCYMILQTEKYEQKNISEYIPLIDNCLIFFDEHYQYLAKQRGIKSLDGDGHLILYPGSAAETFKMATNANSTIAALQTVTNALLQSAYLKDDRKKYYQELLKRIPPLTFSKIDNYTTIAPAKSWERINNTEPIQLYPVFPWGIFGVGKKGLDTAINTYLYDSIAIKFRSHVGWKQDNIFSARLGLTDEAARLALLKLNDSKNKFPTFWGPGFDWTPDHNWGGSGMIGLQETLLQTDDKKIFLFPAWPKEWNVHFKLHVPYNTTIEATLKDGKVQQLNVLPKEREKDVTNMLNK